MKKNKVDYLCFSSIRISEPIIYNKTVKSIVTLEHLNKKKYNFVFINKYENNLKNDHIPLLRMAFCMPLLNYGLFTKKFILDFEFSNADLSLLNDLNIIFSRDIFVNKILRRRANFILPDFFPNEKLVEKVDAEPKAKIEPIKIIKDKKLTNIINPNSCGILSSGGKESLLTYCILKEIGIDVYPFYMNESGGHWRTAISTYRFHKKIEKNTQKIWTNVDRFYNFMLDNLKFIRKDFRKVKADTYPIRLCIFPFYVFSFLPIFIENRIGNLLIGSEFDDQRTVPSHLGINHYYGIYDQHQDFDLRMEKWYKQRIPGLKQWSAVRNISGLIVERILTKRYTNFAKLQRSCHSCHFEKKKIVPCGTCSKCMGVLLFLMANDVNPKIMNFNGNDISSFLKNIESEPLRLDQDEKDHSLYLLSKKNKTLKGKYIDHIEKIHDNKSTCNIQYIPEQFRKNILKIIEGYTKGYCVLKNNNWMLNKKKI
jgi:hypothetical protein